MSEVAVNAASPGISQLAPTQEAPVLETPAAQAPDKDARLSSQFAALSKQEKALFLEKKRLSEERKEIEGYRKAKGVAKENPLQYLAEGGLTLDDLIQFKLKQGEPPSADEKLKTIEEKLAAIEAQKAKDEELAKQTNIDRAVSAFKAEIMSVIEKDPAKYEFIAARNAHEEVYNVIAQYWDENEHLPPDKRRLPIEKAAELVENELFEQHKPLKGLSKFKALFAPEPEAKPDTSTKAPEMSAPPRTTTLTNSNTASTPGVEQKRLLSREESIKVLAKQLEESMRKKG